MEELEELELCARAKAPAPAEADSEACATFCLFEANFQLNYINNNNSIMGFKWAAAVNCVGSYGGCCLRGITCVEL